MRRTVLPQAMRVIIPPTGNEVISMLKTTSLVTAVPYSYDLYSIASREIAARTFEPVPMLLVAATWYLVITSVLMVGAVLPREVLLPRHFPKVDLQAARGLGQGADRYGGGTRMTGEPMVRAERVCKDFGALSVLKGVTLSVDPGKVLVLVGPSGSGKSTFLRCINHLEKRQCRKALRRRSIDRLSRAWRQTVRDGPPA